VSGAAGELPGAEHAILGRVVAGPRAWETLGSTLIEGVAITLFPFRADFRALRRLRRARLAAQSVAVALEVVDLAVMEQPIDERGGERRVVQDATPSVRLLFEVMIVAFFSYRVAMIS
jgi:hypothetical protein